MTANRPQRPAGIIVLGVLAILVAMLLLVSGAMAGAMWTLVLQEDLARVSSQEPLPPGFGWLDWMFEHFAWIAAGQAVVGVTLLVVAIGFLRLRPWALTGMRALTWFFLVFMVLYSVGFSWVWWSSAGPLAELPDTGPDLEAFRWLGLAGGLLGSVFWATPLVLALWFLRREEMERVFRPEEPPGSSALGAPDVRPLDPRPPEARPDPRAGGSAGDPP